MLTTQSYNMENKIERKCIHLLIDLGAYWWVLLSSQYPKLHFWMVKKNKVFSEHTTTNLNQRNQPPVISYLASKGNIIYPVKCVQPIRSTSFGIVVTLFLSIFDLFPEVFHFPLVIFCLRSNKNAHLVDHTPLYHG